MTVSKTDINFHGWVGCGYIIIDQTTGAGAYMISGGLSGGVLLVALLLLSAFLLLSIAFFIGPIALAVVSILLPFYLAFQAWLATQASQGARDCVQALMISALGQTLLIATFATPTNILARFLIGRLVSFSIDNIGVKCLGIEPNYAY